LSPEIFLHPIKKRSVNPWGFKPLFKPLNFAQKRLDPKLGPRRESGKPFGIEVRICKKPSYFQTRFVWDPTSQVIPVKFEKTFPIITPQFFLGNLSKTIVCNLKICLE